MSTYTDLHNKIKENLTVGYSPDDRITTQKVRFYNEGNEYWGTFKGTLRAEQVDLEGGELRNVKITGALLSNISWPGGVDFDAFGALLTNVSAEVDSINDIKLPAAHQRITDEMSARVAEDGALKSMILNTDVRLSTFSQKIENDMRREMSALKLDITYQTKKISGDLYDRSYELSTELSNSINNLSISFNTSLNAVSSELSTQDAAISVELHDKIDTIYEKLTNDDLYLSNQLSITQINLVNEIGDRSRIDACLSAEISSAVADSIQRDSDLNDKIDENHVSACLSLDIMHNDLTTLIEDDRHYTWKKQSSTLEDVNEYPFKLVDYAVNAFNFTDIYGRLYYQKDTKKIYLGSVSKNATDENVLPFDVIPQKNNTADDLKKAFNTHKIYHFSDSEKYQYTDTGYILKLSPPLFGEDQLSNYSLNLEPHVENYHAVVTPVSNTKVGYVTEALPIGSSTEIISGYLTIDPLHDDDDYRVFRPFYNIKFNDSELSSYEDTEHQIAFTYYGRNSFDLIKYDTPKKYIQLSDTIESHVTTTFGEIHEFDEQGHKSIISTATGIKQIKVWLQSPEYAPFNPYVLTPENNFHLVIDEDYTIPGDGAKAKISLEADVKENAGTAAFTVGQQSAKYMYTFSGKNAAGNIQELGYIVPKVFNRTITSFDTDYDEISAYISNVVYFESMKQYIGTYPVVLTRSTLPGEEGIWYTTKRDLNGNVLDVKYIGATSELRLRITVCDESSEQLGQIIAQKYTVDLSTPRPVAGTDRKVLLFQTNQIDLTNFDHSERPYSTYRIAINKDIENADYASYLLKFETDTIHDFNAIIPARKVDDPNLLREFILDIQIQSSTENDTSFRRFHLIDEDGQAVELLNTTQDDSIYVNPNRRAIYAIKEVVPGKFIAVDLNDEQDNQWINVLDRRTQLLSAEISNLSTSLSIDIDTLSANLSSDIDTLSTWLSIDIDALSTNLSTDINVLSSRLSNEIDSLSTALSTDIDILAASLCVDIVALSTNLSTDIDNLSASLCSTVQLSVTELQNQVISNDNDIEFLSTEIDALSTNLSTDISALSSQISAEVSALSVTTITDISVLSTDLSDLSSHYHKTLSLDIGLEHQYENPHSGDTMTRSISVDQILIVDEVTFDRYRLTIRNGALNINKIDNLATFD